jgi:hypothetical protein
MLCPPLRRWNHSGVRCWCCVPPLQSSPADRAVCLICPWHLASTDLPVRPMYTFPRSLL